MDQMNLAYLKHKARHIIKNNDLYSNKMALCLVAARSCLLNHCFLVPTPQKTAQGHNYGLVTI